MPVEISQLHIAQMLMYAPAEASRLAAEAAGYVLSCMGNKGPEHLVKVMENGGLVLISRRQLSHHGDCQQEMDCVHCNI